MRIRLYVLYHTNHKLLKDLEALFLVKKNNCQWHFIILNGYRSEIIFGFMYHVPLQLFNV